MEKLSKLIYDFVEQLLRMPHSRSLLCKKNNRILEFLLAAHHEALSVELKEKLGDRYE